MIAQTSHSPQPAPVPGAAWESVTPEAKGYSAKKLAVLKDWLALHPSTAVMVVAGGKVLFQYGDVARNSKVASVRKSILGILCGKYVANGTLDPGRTVVSYGVEDSSPYVADESKAVVEQLMASRSGVYLPSGNKEVDEFLPKRGTEYPGSYHVYNNWDFNALGVVFEKATGLDIFAALQQDLAVPIGMQDFQPELQKKIPAPPSSLPEYAMWLSTRDLARVGLLMLHQGHWGAKEIEPQWWLQYMTNVVTHFDAVHPNALANAGYPGRWGYGLLWWVWDAPVYPGGTYSGPLQGAYTAMGTGGQFVTVLPMLDMVVVHKVDIDAHPSANVSLPEYQTMLDMIVEARCAGPCKTTDTR